MIDLSLRRDVGWWRRTRWVMYFGMVVGALLAAEIVGSSRSGGLERLLFEGGSPWPVVAIIGAVLLVFALGAPRMASAVGACVGGAVLFAALDPRAPHPEKTFFVLTVLAGLAGLSVLVAVWAGRRSPQLAPPATSSRQVRAMTRAHATRRAAA